MVILDLRKSKFIYEYSNFIYYFSSDFNLQRFHKGLNDYIDYRTKMLKARFDLDIGLDDFFAIKFYRKIEKRGFRIYGLKSKTFIEDPNRLYLNGDIHILSINNNFIKDV